MSAATPTDPNLKVAFIGDSAYGSGFDSVMTLIKNEGAQAVVHQGDFDYNSSNDPGGDAAGFEAKINSNLGSNFPYFASAGNHDDNAWVSNCADPQGCYSNYFKDRMTRIGVVPDSPNLDDFMYSTVFRGLKIVMVGTGGEGKGSSHADTYFAPYIQNQLQADDHIWRICSWHYNQNTMQVGGKGDQAGWGVYDTCRSLGAIIATGHEHTYHRTKTLTSMQNLAVDLAQHPKDANGVPQNPNNLLVAPGKSFVFVSGLGGNSIRTQQRCTPSTYPYGGGLGCNYIWANIYTSDQGAKFGALFITFNYNGNPNRAHAYFKNIDGQIIDEFDILASGTPGPTNTPGPSPTTGPTPTPLPPTPTTPPGCTTSSTTWQNTSFTSQTGIFTAQFDMTPNVNPMDGVAGLSSGVASGYSNLATIVRFNPTGFIDARNGANYTAAATIPYTAGSRYHFRLVVDFPNRTYSAYVTPPGGSEQLVGANYAFRSDWNTGGLSGGPNLNNLGVYAQSGSHLVCSLTISQSTSPSPTPPPSPSPTPTVIVTIKNLLLNWLSPTLDRNSDGKVNSLDFALLVGPPPSTPTSTPTPSGPTSTPIPISGNSRGYVTTPGELLYVKQKAASGVEPYKSARDLVISRANSSLRTFNAPDAQCSRQNDYWYNSYTIEAKAMAYWLTDDANYANQVVAGLRDATAHPASRTPTSHGDQCNLSDAWYSPGVVIAADLMEGYSGWSANDKQAFQNYLAESMYPFTAASGRNSHNWGTGGDMSSAFIADYLWNRPDLRLTTLDNTPRSPAQAYEFHAQRQIGRINGTYIFNSDCPLDPGIRADGGLSEELQRGSTGCYGTTLLACDASWTYTITSLESVIMHAELLWRRGSGDRRIYDNVGPNGKGQLKKAIHFTVNSSCDWKDSHKHSLELSYRYYRDSETAASLGIGGSRYVGDYCGQMMHYGTISHGFSMGENPGPPPRVPAP